ncbi:MAG TPA: antitoxin Xre/MbcA/ParS toxin-binding domain-containing protein [Jatrophihabitantaceae bacterium]|nr:antitoxin Xre/MbcA/ParS toxin-binding domain-containing protein [Jatrophihabitantaceae bacterium]
MAQSGAAKNPAPRKRARAAAVPLPTATIRALPSPATRSGTRPPLVVAAGASSAFPADVTVARLIDMLGNNGLARILGVSNSQPTRWRQGKESISPANRRRLSDLDHVLDRLLLELWPDQAGDWLTSPNAHLGGAIPIDVLVLRGAGAVLDAIDALAVGAFA